MTAPMDRNHVLNLMSELRLRGMRASYDEVLADRCASKASVTAHCGSWKWRWRTKKRDRFSYRMTTGKAADGQRHQDFDFSASVSGFISWLMAHCWRRAAIGTGTGKTHLAVAVARMCIGATDFTMWWIQSA